MKKKQFEEAKRLNYILDEIEMYIKNLKEEKWMVKILDRDRDVCFEEMSSDPSKDITSLVIKYFEEEKDRVEDEFDRL